MPRLVQFLLALIVGVALLARIVTGFVQETARRWFERDVSVGARLVVTGARATLAAHWSKDQRQELQSQLTDIARGEQQVRMRAMCSLVAHFNVYRWAGKMLVDATQLRSRERLTGKLAERAGSAAAK